MMLADFEPGIFFILLWGLLSWLSSRKKKKINTDTDEVIIKPKEDLFARLQKLQEHFSQEAEIFTSAPPPVDVKDEYFTEDDENFIEEPEILETGPEDVHESEGCVFETDTKVPATSSDNWLKQNLSGKSELKKLIVLKEILGKPRSICPYTGNYYQ